MNAPWQDSPVELRPLRPSVGVTALIAATVVLYLVQLIPGAREWTFTWGVLAPPRVWLLGEVWRLATYLFLHSPFNPFHVAFNMLALWMFGMELEQRWGTRTFVLFYILCGVGAGVFSTIAWDSRILGASGAVLALLTAYAYYYPRRQILMFFVFPLPVWLAVTIIGIISLVSARVDSSVAHLTHLGGIAVALGWLVGVPIVRDWMARIDADAERRQAERTRAAAVSREHYFQQTIDPILKKISEEGMESLTETERRALKDASRRHGDRLKRERIVPFDTR